tara:strand:+ start:381 stop:545 length:165 start_codon:yes stop_codon:yes gene_type:complete
MTEKLGAITLLIVSVIALTIFGNEITYYAGLLQLIIYTIGVIGLVGAGYMLVKK